MLLYVASVKSVVETKASCLKSNVNDFKSSVYDADEKALINIRI